MSEFPFPNPSRVLPARFSLFRWEIVDHRGQVVPRATKRNAETKSAIQPKTQSFWSWPDDWNTYSKHDIRQIVLVVTPLVLAYAGVMLLGKAANLAAVWLLPRYFGEGQRTTSELWIRIALTVGFYLVFSVIGWFAILASYQRLLIPELARATLRKGRCASCNYPLENLNPASDGCTICPECGSAWKLNGPVSN